MLAGSCAALSPLAYGFLWVGVHSLPALWAYFMMFPRDSCTCLLVHLLAGEFMLARYREVVEVVLHFRESKEKLIRRAVIALIPRLAAFAPERFAATYLPTCTDYLINTLKSAPPPLASLTLICTIGSP